MIKPFHIKKLLAWIFNLACLSATMHRCQVKLFSPFIRAVYYHDVPPSEAQSFEQQLRYFAQHFSSVGYEELIQFHNNGWPKDKPGLILSFDDGHRSCSEVVAPILDKYGFVGWFFVPPALLDVPIEEQHRKAVEHRLVPKPFDYGTSRVFLTWDEVRALDRKHVIGCHTFSHCRLRPALSDRQLYQEIVASKQILEEKLNHEIRVFAWVGGEESSYSRRAAELIREANYKVAFLTNNAHIGRDTDLHFLNRTYMDSSFSADLMQFQLSGFLDAVYAPKRRRVAALVADYGVARHDGG